MGSTEKIRAQQRLIELSKQILGGEIDLATGVGGIWTPLRELNLWDKDEYIVFTAFVSETDHLPLPKYKNNWEQKAYAEKANELKQFEDTYREKLYAACRTLIEFLEHQQY